MTANEAILTQLQRLGLTGYEAKAYLALLAAGRALTGYECAKLSGLPRSAIYETLAKLVRSGAVFQVRGDAGDQGHYVPLAAEDFLARLQRDFEQNVQELERGLRSISQPAEAHLIHHLSGADVVFTRAQDVIGAARETVHVSAWPDHLEGLLPALRDAESRKVATWIHTWGGADIDVGNVYSNPLTHPDSTLDRTDWIWSRLGSRLLSVVSDRRVIVAAGSNSMGVWGIYTDDPAVVLLGLETIVHFIVADVVIQAMGPQEFLSMWESRPDLMSLALGGDLQSRIPASGANQPGD